MTGFTHIDEHGRPGMVDVGGKPATRRTASAQARVAFPAEVARQLRSTGHETAKGPVLTTARIAAIMAAKQTHELIPLCHPLAIDRCDVDLVMEGDELLVRCDVSCRGSTGVEMEALTAATVAALTVYDMCKALSHAIVIRDIRLLAKSGGRRDVDSSGMDEIGDVVP